MNIGNQYVQSRSPNALEKVFDAYGARGIKKAQQDSVAPSPFKKAMPYIVDQPGYDMPVEQSNGRTSLEQVLSRLFNGESNLGTYNIHSIMDNMFGSIAKRQSMFSSANEVRSLRNQFLIDTPIRRALRSWQ